MHCLYAACSSGMLGYVITNHKSVTLRNTRINAGSAGRRSVVASRNGLGLSKSLSLSLLPPQFLSLPLSLPPFPPPLSLSPSLPLPLISPLSLSLCYLPLSFFLSLSPSLPSPLPSLSLPPSLSLSSLLSPSLSAIWESLHAMQGCM